MTTTPLVATATVTVRVGIDDAFRLFTEDIDLWWRRGTMYWNDAERALGYRLEPVRGGRLVEVYDEKTGEGFEIGRVSEWDPPRRVVFGWRLKDWPEDAATTVAVAFETVPEGTRVTVEHSGWETFGGPGAQLTAGYVRGWKELLGWYSEAA